MSAIETKTAPRTEDLLRSVEQLSATDFQDFLTKAVRARAERQSLHPELSETELVEKAQESLPPSLWQEYYALKAKFKKETQTEEEYARLLELSDQIEIQNAQRVGYLVALAQRRQMTLDEVMKSVGIPPPGNA
jgi:hypothetical protein